jgi:hypothetical protein
MVLEINFKQIDSVRCYTVFSSLIDHPSTSIYFKMFCNGVTEVSSYLQYVFDNEFDIYYTQVYSVCQLIIIRFTVHSISVSDKITLAEY